MAKIRSSNKQTEQRKGLELDWDTADHITRLTLRDTFYSMQDDVEKMVTEVERGEHVEINQKDIGYNIVMLTHLKQVLEHFGEKV